jgi:hypothetical protein
MNTTNLNWNTENPKFEDVEGKHILVEFKSCDGVMMQRYTAHLMPDEYLTYFGFGTELYRYTILNTEPKFCEWTKDDYKDGFDISCSDRLWISGMFRYQDFPICPYCGLLIKVITEPKVMEYRGMKPELSQVSDAWWKILWEYHTESYVFTNPSKVALIEAWNKFATKMKGE